MKLDKVRQSLDRAFRHVALQYNIMEIKVLYDKIFFQDDLNHYLTQSLDNPRKVSYAQKPEYKFEPTNRTKTTLGRYIKRNYDIDIADNTLDKFVAAVISRLPGVFNNFRTLKGDDIEEAYANELGGHSCMTGECAKLTRIYAENPDKVSLLTLGYEARALVWKTDDGITVLDRIYPNDGQHVDLFQKYAKDQGWIIRDHNSMPMGNVKIDGNMHKVTLNIPSHDLFPYMDTFRYAVLNENKIILSNHYTNDSVSLERTDGELPRIYYCVKCDERINDINIVWINSQAYCGNCAIICLYCSMGVLKEESRELPNKSYYCKRCFDLYFTNCKKCNIILSKRFMVMLADDYYCANCYNKITT